MNYKYEDNKVIIENIRDFDIEEILECGQCFRFIKNGEKNYTIIACNRVLNIHQTKDRVEFSCSKEDFENIWFDYFDMGRDYSLIKSEICKNDEIMAEAVDYAKGIRILNQQPLECLLSFIISQNNNIPRIKGIISKMSEKYGTECGEYYLFPTLEQMELATVEQLFDLKMGFRAKYIYDALEKLNNREVNLADFSDLSLEQARESLLKIKGVGRKVADCVLLFSLGYKNVFPTDVWVKRVMETLYFNDEPASIEQIHTLADEKWGEYAGFAQQYLFYYARSMKIGVKK